MWLLYRLNEIVMQSNLHLSHAQKMLVIVIIHHIVSGTQCSLYLFLYMLLATPPPSTDPSAHILDAQASVSVCSQRKQSSLNSNSSQNPPVQPSPQ